MSLSRDEILALIVQRSPSIGCVLRPEARLGAVGLDSLDQVELILVVDELFGIRLEIEDLEPQRTVGELAQRIAERSAEVLPTMMYAEYLSTAEAHRWILDTDIAWSDINQSLAWQQPDLLDRVRDSALIESFFPLFTPRALSLLWDDVNATAIFSIQLYESYKHFQVFNQYLQCVGYRPIEEVEIVAIRRRNEHLQYSDGTELLTRYMMSEHFAAQHFFKDARLAREPVLAHILQLVARDEVRHAQFAYDLLDLRVRRDPSSADKIVKSAREFRHIGLDVVGEMPIAQKNDFSAILMLNQKLHRLTGRGLESWTEEPTDERTQPDVEAQLVSAE